VFRVDPVAVCRYLGERDVINHVHFRNVVVRKPYVDDTEMFLDDGQVDLFGVRMSRPSSIEAAPEEVLAKDLKGFRSHRQDANAAGSSLTLQAACLKENGHARSIPG
jgi:hypothetical protein